VNRAIGASYGEVTGITQTVRNYGSSLGIAVLGTVLTTVFANRLTSSFVTLGLPEHTASTIAHTAANGGAGQSDISSAPAALRNQIAEIVSRDYALATRAVLYGMAIALFLTFLAARAHPGGRADSAVTDEQQAEPDRLAEKH
jgi:hypothetical protein